MYFFITKVLNTLIHCLLVYINKVTISMITSDLLYLAGLYFFKRSGSLLKIDPDLVDH